MKEKGTEDSSTEPATPKRTYKIEGEDERNVVLWICSHLLPDIVTSEKRKRMMNAPNDKKPKLFTWATVSDITFAILVCENYYYKWITLEQYTIDHKEEEHPHKGKIKGKYSKGNMLSGPEGQARYAEIRKRLVQIAEDKKLKEEYETAFTEKFCKEQPDFHKDAKPVSNKRSKVPQVVVIDEGEENAQKYTGQEFAMVMGVPMPELGDDGQFRPYQLHRDRL